MQHAIQMGLATVGALSILSHALSAEAATIQVSQQETNNSVAQTVGQINESTLPQSDLKPRN